MSKDLNGLITTWNRGAERLFGYAASEMIGRSITTLIPPDRHHEEVRILDRIRRGERVDPYETVRQRRDGSLVDVSVSVSPLRNSAGEVVGASKIARDITERKKAELALAERNLQLALAERAALRRQLRIRCRRQRDDANLRRLCSYSRFSCWDARDYAQ